MRGGVPFWVWIVGAVVAFQVLDDLGRLVPFIFLIFVFSQLRSSSRRKGVPPQPSTGPTATSHLPPPVGTSQPPPPVGSPPTGETAYPAWSDPTTAPASAAPMPTIDVPRYPGAGATGGGSVTGVPGGDPAVTLSLLQIGQMGRDLRDARTAGNTDRVRQVLLQLAHTVERAEDAVTMATPRPPRSLRGDLERLHGQVTEARRAGEDVQGAVLDRVATSAVGIGETGPHE